MVAPVSTSRALPALAKYEVIEEIGHGGMATVYRARDKRLARDVAVKVIHPHLRDSPEVAHRFVTEAQAVAKLRHRNIVEVFDVSADDDAEMFLVVELVRGQTLRRLLKEHAPLPPEIAAAIAIDVLAGLSHAHAEGVIHRDVKPENVLLEHRALRGDGETVTPVPASGGPGPSSGDGTRVSVKLTDFGIAKLLDAQGVTSTGQVLGSPAHMAPEQIEGGAVDARADVFGIGVMLYESMVGHLPFQGQNPAQVLRRVLEGQYSPAEIERPEVGKRLSAILDRALAHEASARFESAAAMQNELAAELKRVGVESPARELEAYFDDPEAYTADHKKRTIAKLCDLAQIARRDGRVLDAAADYNRALAYAPDDPQLLRIVSRMQRDAARARLFRRAWPLGLATVAVMVGAYFLTQSLKAKPKPVGDPVVASTTHALAVAPSTSASVTAPATASVAETASVATAHVTATASATQKIERTITLASIFPATVSLNVDGADMGMVSSGKTLVLDGREHALLFDCAGQCEPLKKTIPAGKSDEQISVELHLKDAILTVTSSNPNATFAVDGMAGLFLRPGVATHIVVPGAGYIVVFDVANPSHRKQIKLTRGQQHTLDF